MLRYICGTDSYGLEYKKNDKFFSKFHGELEAAKLQNARSVLQKPEQQRSFLGSASNLMAEQLV